MFRYSIVMPIYRRSEILPVCLDSIKKQSIQPNEIIFVDNNTNEIESKRLYNILNDFNYENKYSFKIIKSPKNSSAIARNIGALNSTSELVAFLDSDVILEPNYYEIIIEYFERYKNLIAIQGVDKALIDSSKKSKRINLLRKLLYHFEQFFETSTLLNRDKIYVSPSLAVSHPNVEKDFELESQWISTCAGVFKRNIFSNYLFPDNFITYSNNEYLFLSYSLFKNKEGQMMYVSKAKYRDIQTTSGRLNTIDLIYQIQTYDLFIFNKLFSKNIINVFIYLKSRIGQLIYNLLKAYFDKNLSIRNFLLIVFALFYPFINYRYILKNDLSFYEKDFNK